MRPSLAASDSSYDPVLTAYPNCMCQLPVKVTSPVLCQHGGMQDQQLLPAGLDRCRPLLQQQQLHAAGAANVVTSCFECRCRADCTPCC